MKLMLMVTVVSAVVLAMGVMGCGGMEEQCGGCQAEAILEPTEQTLLDADVVVILGAGLASRDLNVELWNNASGERVCSLTYRYATLTGGTVSGPILPPAILNAGQRRTGTVEVPYAHKVIVTATCRHPGWPDVDLTATTSVEAPAMIVDRDCLAAYSETAGVAQMQVPCY